MQVIDRAEWEARPAKSTPLGINTQSGTAHWEGTTMGVFAHESCATKVRAIQAFHMDSRGWNDIAYNFVVCPHGFVFIGRGHGVRSAANGTNQSNQVSEAVCYLGGVGDPFTESGQWALAEILNEISNEHHCHRDWFNTQCPGEEICGWVVSGMPNSAPTVITPQPTPNNSFPEFPLPADHWFGKPNRDNRNHSGYYNSTDRPGIALAQQVMRDYAGQDIKSDGFFGAKTEEAVMNIQRVFNLKNDGLIGPETWGALAYLWAVNH